MKDCAPLFVSASTLSCEQKTYICMFSCGGKKQTRAHPQDATFRRGFCFLPLNFRYLIALVRYK